MPLAQFRIPQLDEQPIESVVAATMLRSILGYDALTNPSDANAAEPLFVAGVTHAIDDAKLVEDWASLEAEGVLSVFQAYSWQRGLVSHLVAEGVEPIFVTVRDGRTGRPIAILPLQRHKQHGLQVIDYLAFAFCDTCQPLLSVDACLTKGTMPAFLAAVVSVLPKSDILRLAKMQQTLFDHQNPFTFLPGQRASADETFPVELQAGREGFVVATSAYKSYQKQWRKLSRRDGVAFEMFETPEAIAEAFDRMIVMRDARFNDLNRRDLLNDPKVRAFYRAMALLPEQTRAVRIVGLKVGDSHMAYIYMMDTGGKFSTVISAMDNSVGNAYAPGLILFTKIFERAVEHGYAHGDMGIGCMFYKTRFAARKNPLFIWEHPLSLRGGVVLAALATWRNAKQWAKNSKTIRMIVHKIRQHKSSAATPMTVEASTED